MDIFIIAIIAIIAVVMGLVAYGITRGGTTDMLKGSESEAVEAETPAVETPAAETE